MSDEIAERHARMRDDTARSVAAIAAAHAKATPDTHWSRILHFDLFGAECDGAKEPPPGGASRSAEPSSFVRFARSPLRATAVALGAYAAMHLAVAGVLHALHAPEAAAAFLPVQGQTPTADSKHAHASQGPDAR